MLCPDWHASCHVLVAYSGRATYTIWQSNLAELPTPGCLRLCTLPSGTLCMCPCASECLCVSVFEGIFRPHLWCTCVCVRVHVCMCAHVQGHVPATQARHQCTCACVCVHVSVCVRMYKDMFQPCKRATGAPVHVCACMCLCACACKDMFQPCKRATSVPAECSQGTVASTHIQLLAQKGKPEKLNPTPWPQHMP